MKLLSDRVQFSNHLFPNADNQYDIGGGTGLRWQDIYASNGTIQTSDSRQKTDIVECPLGLEFLREVEPVSYKWINTKNGPGVRTHYGFTAQNIKAAGEAVGLASDGSQSAFYTYRESACDITS